MTPIKSTAAIQYRVRSDIAEAAKTLAQHRGLTESRLVEELLVEASRAENLLRIDSDDPGEALEALSEGLKELLGSRLDQRAMNRA